MITKNCNKGLRNIYVLTFLPKSLTKAWISDNTQQRKCFGYDYVVSPDTFTKNNKMFYNIHLLKLFWYEFTYVAENKCAHFGTIYFTSF